MFACSVCFYSTDVLSGKRYFRSNEILTACLNLRTGDLRDVLEELKSLRQKIQLPEELDIEFDENYDRYVQQAQNLLFKIGRLAKRIPLYRDDHSFDAPQLMDCLCLSNIIRLLFPLRYPMICDTLYFGGILMSICTWSLHSSASMISIPFCWHSCLNIFLISTLISPYIAILRYFGANTTWY